MRNKLISQASSVFFRQLAFFHFFKCRCSTKNKRKNKAPSRGISLSFLETTETTGTKDHVTLQTEKIVFCNFQN